MTPRPASFEPLASGDPVPGDAYEVAALGRRLSDTAAEIEIQVRNLRKLAEHSTEFWTGKAAAKFHDAADDLAGRIEKAQGRYDKTGAALSGWSQAIDEAQGDVYPAVVVAQEAEQALRNTSPLPNPPAGSPPPTPEQEASTRHRAAAHGDAQTRLNNARHTFEAAVGVYNSKAKKAADAINDASSHDGLKDSWWDRNFHWIQTVMKWVAIVIIVLAVIAIIIACPLSAGLFAALAISAETLATVATVVEIATAVLVTASLAFDTAAAMTDKQGWTPVIMDAIALCTFGFGKLAEAGLGGLARYGEGVGKAVSSGRVGRAAVRARGLPGTLYSLATHSPLARTVMELSPRLTSVLADADTAAAGAVRSLESTVGAAKASPLVAAMAQSGDLATDWAKLAAVGDHVPGVLRLAVAKAAGGAIAAADSAAQSVTFAVTSSYTGVSQITELIEDRKFEARLEQIVERWSHPLVHVP